MKGNVQRRETLELIQVWAKKNIMFIDHKKYGVMKFHKNKSVKSEDKENIGAFP